MRFDPFMIPSQLDLLPVGHSAEQLRKRFFWKRMMWISLIIGVILMLAAVGGYVKSMIHTFSTLQQSGAADPSELANDISSVLLILLWSLPPACLAFLVSMVSFIRLLSLPRLPKC